MPKRAKIIDVPTSCNSLFLHKYLAQFLNPSRSTSKSFYLYKSIPCKIFGFFSCNRILIDVQCEKNSISLGKTWFSIISYVHNYLLKFFHQGVNWKLSSSGKLFPWKTLGFGTCIRILIDRKIRKNAINFESCRHLNWCFAINTGLISSIEISIENFTF